MITRCLRFILFLLFLTVWQVAFAQNVCASFTYDAAGRVISQTLPDNRVIGFEYYADGELKSITPPNSQRHVFSYTSKNDTDGYQPPQIAGQSGDTVYRYNKDRQLTQIALPGGAQVNYVYDAIKGRLNQVTAGSLRYGYHYNDTTGELIKLSDTAGNEIEITPDGPLLEKVDYRGEVAASVAYGYDRYWRVNQQTLTVGGKDFTQNYTYADNDQLLNNSGISLSYDKTTRQMTGSTFAEINQKQTYDNFGQQKTTEYTFDLGKYADSVSIDFDIVTNTTFKLKGAIADSDIAYVTVGGKEFIPDSQGKFSGTVLLKSHSTHLKINYYNASNELLHHTYRNIYYSFPSGHIARKLYRLTEDKLYYGENQHRDDLYVYDAKNKSIKNIPKPATLPDNSRLISVDNQGVTYYRSLDDKVRAYLGNELISQYDVSGFAQLTVTQSGELFGYKRTPIVNANQAQTNDYSIYEFTPTGQRLYSTFNTKNTLIDLAEDQHGKGLLALMATGIMPAQQDCRGYLNRLTGECFVPHNIQPSSGHQVIHILKNDVKVLISEKNQGIFYWNRIIGSSVGLLCYSKAFDGGSCYYPNRHGGYQSYHSEMFDDTSIGFGDTSLVNIAHIKGKHYPQLVVFPGKGEEKRVRLLTDINAPTIQGTLAITNQGGGLTTFYSNNYTYDAIGRIKTIHEQRQHQRIEHRYVYNDVGKLIEATTDGTTQTWQYDANGNRTHENGAVVATYDAQDRLTKYKGNTYQYNALGQLAQKTSSSGADSFNYDVFGNLRAVTLANGDDIEYLIDPKNRRIGKKKNGQVVQKFVYQDQLNPLAELYPNNTVKNLFIYAEKSNVPSAVESYDNSGKLIGKFRIISNHLGSVVMVVNAETGDIAQEITYDVWGNVLSDTNPNFQPFYFAGGIYDTDTKLTRFGARDYDAETGRWTAKDPIGFAGGLTSLYDYVGGDPVNYIDPSGNRSIWRNPQGATYINSKPGRHNVIPRTPEPGWRRDPASNNMIFTGLRPITNLNRRLREQLRQKQYNEWREMQKSEHFYVRDLAELYDEIYNFYKMLKEINEEYKLKVCKQN